MRASRLLTSAKEFAAEFSRCCEEYGSLHIAVAWGGSPAKALPFDDLKLVSGEVSATIGIAFNQTHPDAIEELMDLGADVRVVRDESPLFHPKVYFFSEGNRYAVFVGSSNLTYSGFNTNTEVNVLLEGRLATGKARDVRALKDQLHEWHSDAHSFTPDDEWLKRYREAYRATVKKQESQGLQSPPLHEEAIPTASWLGRASWGVYYGRVIAGLEGNERTEQGYHTVLDAATERLPLPWDETVFDDIERRRVIWGLEPYGWLGHVGASGGFRELLASGSSKDHRQIAKLVTRVGRMNHPVAWADLQADLDGLVQLGPTMKVWGRLLCLVRPDLFCTVSSPHVQKNLSITLGVPQSSFQHPSGYIRLLKLIHSSPWFQSRRPRKKEQVPVWERRAAFLDAIFY